MAEHVRNELARAGQPIRPNRILTIEKFLEPFTPLKRPLESLLHLLIAQIAPNEFPGYHRALAALIQEAPVDALPPEIARIAGDVEEALAARGYALRPVRLREAALPPNGSIIFDGFFTFAPAELAWIERLAINAAVTVTLPDWPGSSAARARLIAAGFSEQRLETALRNPVRTVLAAASLDQEVEQIALRILDYAARGRPFREMGILLRVRDPYAPALESSLSRYGIPARFHFAEPLSAHPSIQYLAGIVRAMLNGRDHAALLALRRMPVSGIGATAEGDRLDFKVRDTLPASGPPQWWPELELPAPPFATAPEFAACFKTLRRLIPAPEITDGVDHELIQIWRSTAAALDAFEIVLDTVALALSDARTSLAHFWSHVESALAVEKLRVPDRRRNVVNIVDVVEARQWELPIAFVCGLNERHFPQYHREDPLLPDAARREANLPTSEDRQQEERFLFDLAVTRATEEIVLSYARFNDRGDASLRSFFLEEKGETASAARVLPRPTIPTLPDLPSQTLDLRTRHATLSASSIESFLQCPFQFFARKTLRLRERPSKPRDRLDNLLQGIILHRAIAEGSLDHVFEEECATHNIPATYRKEAVRLELLRHFEAFQADGKWTLHWPAASEQEFLFRLSSELSIRGRIDRVYTGPKREAIVVDFKYSTSATLRDRLDSDPVQGGLYLLAAERAFKQNPVAMFYCGLRQSVSWEGWHSSVPGLDLGENVAPGVLREMMEAAEQKAAETFDRITAGHREVRPTDPLKCRYCEFVDMCRVETAAGSRSLAMES
ncbi:MAG TPA: PD-(D/E)XK nuclease family protein [Bryobacteraceae bacterium]|nr:PD-(D/E)XK nuclease family protein [Bryobacteraceae bacterium]